MQNKIVTLMALDVKDRNLLKVVNDRFFGVSDDGMTYARNKSMFSLLHRTFDVHLKEDEIFS